MLTASDRLIYERIALSEYLINLRHNLKGTIQILKHKKNLEASDN